MPQLDDVDNIVCSMSRVWEKTLLNDLEAAYIELNGAGNSERKEEIFIIAVLFLVLAWDLISGRNIFVKIAYEAQLIDVASLMYY